MRGTITYPLTHQMADTIRTHGLAWAVRYYANRIPARELRILMTGAYCS